MCDCCRRRRLRPTFTATATTTTSTLFPRQPQLVIAFSTLGFWLGKLATLSSALTHASKRVSRKKTFFVANATTIDDDWSYLLTDSTITTTIIWKSYHLIQVNQRLLQQVITSTAAVLLSLSHFIGSSMHRPTVINQRCN